VTFIKFLLTVATFWFHLFGSESNASRFFSLKNRYFLDAKELQVSNHLPGSQW
jgi:hypothetical protein